MKTSRKKSLLCSALPFLFVLLAVAGASGQTFSAAHTFTALSGSNSINSDGANPYGSLVAIGNMVYGTASRGGDAGQGVVFSCNIDGTGYTNLHSFNGGDGALPSAALVLSGDFLYGTTAAGGSSNVGTIYAIHSDGSGFTNLYSFSGGDDGFQPNGGLALCSNVLYGVTTFGGAVDFGSIFRIGTDGKGYSNLYTFNGDDGTGFPNCKLAISGATLYGETGDGTVEGFPAYGSIFAIQTDGTGFTNIYRFSPLSAGYAGTNQDGAGPMGGLLLSGGTLFGVAVDGGNSGGGIVFRVNTDGGGFTNLHSFALAEDDDQSTNSDGSQPEGGLILQGNMLYGTTTSGGQAGAGTVFQINTDGSSYRTLHSFTALSAQTNGINVDGSNPVAGMSIAGNKLLGTAYQGGEFGNGTVFTVDLPPPPALQIALANDLILFSVAPGATNFLLQSSTNLGSTNWTTLGVAGSISSVPITNSTVKLFYRLVAQ